MQTTTRVHTYGDVAHDHNWRIPEVCEKEKHIDLINGIHEVWYHDRDLRSAYGDIFGDALRNYNAKQKRKDRQMTMDDYMDSVEADTRGRRKRKQKGNKKVIDHEAKKGKKLSYEVVVSIGNTDKARDDEGNVMYDDEEHEVHPQEMPYEVSYAVCKRYGAEFEKRNPHLRVVRGDWHADEFYVNRETGLQEWGTPHLHLEYIPVADGYTRGLEMQNSIGRALEQQGYKDHYEGDKWVCAYDAWQADERAYLEELTRDIYAKYCNNHPEWVAEHGADLEILHPVQGRNAESLAPDAYREMKALDAEIAEKKAELKSLNKTIGNIRQREITQSAREAAQNAREAALDRKAEEIAERDKKSLELAEATQEYDAYQKRNYPKVHDYYASQDNTKKKQQRIAAAMALYTDKSGRTHDRQFGL